MLAFELEDPAFVKLELQEPAGQRDTSKYAYWAYLPQRPVEIYNIGRGEYLG